MEEGNSILETKNFSKRGSCYVWYVLPVVVTLLLALGLGYFYWHFAMQLNQLVTLKGIDLSPKHKMKFDPQRKKFKIVQFTDLHYSHDWTENNANLALQRAVLKREAPVDLVVLTGDAITGWKLYEWNEFPPIWNTLITPMRELNISYAYVLGNHDREVGWRQDTSPRMIMELDRTASQSVSDIGPAPTSAGNYHIPVLSSDSEEEKLILYFFDSGDSRGCDGFSGTGCIHGDQVQWYKEVSMSYRKNFSSVPSMSFFHIPLPAYLDAWNTVPVRGHSYEQICCIPGKDKLFEAMRLMGDMHSIYTGHDHNNDWSAMYKGIKLHYGRKSGYGGYGPPLDMKRGARVIEVTEDPFSVGTWIHEVDGTIITDKDLPLHHPSEEDYQAICCQSFIERDPRVVIKTLWIVGSIAVFAILVVVVAEVLRRKYQIDISEVLSNKWNSLGACSKHDSLLKENEVVPLQQ